MNNDLQLLEELNKVVQGNSKQFNYHMEHIRLAKEYALLLADKLEVDNIFELSFAALAHDLFKERGLDPDKELIWNNHNIPQDNIKYVRSNLDILEKFELDDYFNSSIQYHPLASGIFFYKEFNITNKNILYPIMFHSCPIIDVYTKLPNETQMLIDILILADKLSSNYLRINMKETSVRTDLDLVVFGESGKEFNFTLGLLIANLIARGNDNEKQGIITTSYYYDRLYNMNPLLPRNISLKRLGGKKIWPKRKSLVLKMQ